MRFVNIVGRDLREQTQYMGHAAIAVIGCHVVKFTGTDKFKTGERLLVAPCYVDHAFGIYRIFPLNILMEFQGSNR